MISAIAIVKKHNHFSHAMITSPSMNPDSLMKAFRKLTADDFEEGKPPFSAKSVVYRRLGFGEHEVMFSEVRNVNDGRHSSRGLLAS